MLRAFEGAVGLALRAGALIVLEHLFQLYLALLQLILEVPDLVFDGPPLRLDLLLLLVDLDKFLGLLYNLLFFLDHYLLELLDLFFKVRRLLFVLDILGLDLLDLLDGLLGFLLGINDNFLLLLHNFSLGFELRLHI